ncbi:MAG: ThiF family adenylyltransferase [Pirellulales bacterium]|nr:ThiF family adenylyltransferase [Pirellulales bacterium]
MSVNVTSSLNPTDYVNRFLNRSELLIGKAAISRLKQKKVAIAGCGGVGGATILTLARMGIGAFALADPGLFDEPDANRQWAASVETMGENKARTYDRLVRAINPVVDIDCYPEGVTVANVKRFLRGADVFVDCMDVAIDPELRQTTYEVAAEMGIYSIITPILGFGALVVASEPGGLPLTIFNRMMSSSISSADLPPKLFEIFVPEHLMALQESFKELKIPSVAIAPVIAAALAGTEVLMSLLDDSVAGWRPPLALPEVLAVDPMKLEFQILHLEDFLEATPEKG